LSITTHWAARSLTYGQSGPPLNPNQEIIDGFTSLVPTNGHILLLGVTRKIAEAYEQVTAVDYSEAMIERVWPGNTDTKQAHYDNWLTVDLPLAHYDGIVGDGSVNMLAYPIEVRQLFKRTLSWLKPGGVFACRMFTRPDTPITREHILAEAAAPTMSFSAWRRLFNMLLADQHGGIFPVTEIPKLFDELFPDPSVLPWTNIDAINDYRTSTSTSWFPTRQEILDIAPAGSRFVDVGTYDIADTCPILTFVKQ
jgi:SAM-dependent methyltransferase